MNDLHIETKCYIIECINESNIGFTNISIDSIIELNHMCREVNRYYKRKFVIPKWTYPLFDSKHKSREV